MKQAPIRFLDPSPPSLDLQEAISWAKSHFGLEGSFETLSGERDQNYRFSETGGDVLFKVCNLLDSSDTIACQHAALDHLAGVDPALPIPRVLTSLAGKSIMPVRASDGETYLIRALSYLPGDLLQTTSPNPKLLNELGRLLGRVNRGLAGFFHPAAHQNIAWNLLSSEALIPETRFIEDIDARRLCEDILNRMRREVMPRLKGLRHQVIHADAHEKNVIVDAERGRLSVDCWILGISTGGRVQQKSRSRPITLSQPLDDFLELLAAMTSGYDEVNPLDAEEIEVIADLVLVRWVSAGTIVSWRQKHRQDEPAHVNPGLKQHWQGIKRLHDLGAEAISARLKSACGFPSTGRWTEDASAALRTRRNEVLGQHLSLFYDNPVHVERGRGAWLMGADGKHYLDGYNNVPVCGHSHPHITRAISRQAQALNTNTRYLYANIVEYAEQLTALLDDSLDVCVFVNSGSEANDIAWANCKALDRPGRRTGDAACLSRITDAVSLLSPKI